MMYRQNLLEYWKKLAPAGYRFLERGDLCCLGTDVPLAAVHFVFGSASPQNIAEAQCFFNTLPYTWALPEAEKQQGRLLAQRGYRFEGVFPEMVCNLQRAPAIGGKGALPVIEVSEQVHAQQWLSLAAALFDLNPSLLRDLLGPVIECNAPGIRFLLALHDGEPVGTALLHAGSQTLGIYFFGIAAAWRRRGLGRLLLSDCLEWGRKNHLPFAVLQANDQSISLYSQAGFAVACPLHCWDEPL